MDRLSFIIGRSKVTKGVVPMDVKEGEKTKLFLSSNLKYKTVVLFLHLLS